MNNQLAHIFDDSVCLTKRQLRNYVAGQMSSEEAHALELHLNSCPFCSEAVEGLQLHPEETLAMLHETNSDFLQEHFALHTPHVHLNSLAPAASMPITHKRKNKVQPFWRNASIAAVLLLSFGLMWYLQAGREKPAPLHREVARNVSQPEATAPDNQQAAAPAAIISKTSDESVPAVKPAPAEQPGNNNTRNGGSSQKPQLLISTKSNTDGNKPAAEEEISTKTQAAEEKNTAAEAAGSLAVVTPAPADITVEKQERNKTAVTSLRAAAPPLRKESAADKKYKEDAPGADDAYRSGDYNAALKQYSKDMDDADESRRHTAMLGAANSYIQLGQKDKAIALLQKIVSEGGAEKHKAKALLRQLNKSAQ